MQIGLRTSGQNRQAASHLRVELSNEWPMKPIYSQHNHHHQGSYGNGVGESRRRYVDSFAVSSKPHYVQPRSAAASASTSELTSTASSPANKSNHIEDGTNEETAANNTDRPRSNYVASTLVECGIEHDNCGEHEKALKAFRAALKAQRLSLGCNHLCIAHTLGNMGAVYLKQGRLFLASQALEEAIRMKLKFRMKENDPKQSKIYLGDILNNLGNVAYLRGDFTTSMKYYRTTLKDARSFGKRCDGGDDSGSEQKVLMDTELANALHNIGRLHIHQKEWDAALSVLTECHRLEETTFGADSIRLADTLELIGFVHFSSSNLKAAMTYFSEALSLHRNMHGPLHADVASCLLHIGMVREATGDLKDAWEVYTKSRDVFVRVGVDFSHRGLKAARRSIASIEHLLALEKSNETEQSTTRFIPIEQREIGNGVHFEA